MNINDTKEIKAVKARAKEISKDRGVKHARALDIAARELGYRNWNTLRGVAKTRAENGLPQEVYVDNGSDMEPKLYRRHN